MPGRKARFADAACILALATAAVLLGWFQVRDPDFFWHLEVGRLILDGGSLVRTNTLSGTFPDRPWQNPEWLFEVVLAAADRAGGWLGIALLKAALVAAFAVTLCLAARRQGAPKTFALPLTLVALASVRFRLTERPHLVSALCFALTVLLVQDYRRRGDRRMLLVLPPLFALWANLHPGVVFGLAYLALLGLGDAVAQRLPGGGVPRRDAGLLLAAIPSAAATLLNPAGFGVLTYGWKHREYHQLLSIREFTPAGPVEHPSFYLLALLLACSAAAFRWRRDLPHLAAALAFFAVAVVYRRAVPEAVIVMTVCAAGLAATSLPSWRTRAAALVLPVAALASLAWCLALDRNYPYRFGHGLRDDLLPAGAADFLLREKPPRNLYNEFGLGGYLAYRLHPRYGVFQDGRIPAYPLEFLVEGLTRQSPDSWRSFLLRYGVNTALVRLPYLDPLFPGPEWALVYWDDDYGIAVRRSAVPPDFLERLEYRYAKPFPSAGAPADPAGLRRYAEEMTRNIRVRQQGAPTR